MELDDIMKQLTEGDIPTIELEQKGRIVRNYHYDDIPDIPRAAFIHHHSYIREDREHVRDWEYVIFPLAALETAINNMLQHDTAAVRCRGAKIVHDEHINYGKRIRGAGETVTPVSCNIRLDVTDPQTSQVTLHFTYS